MSGYSPRGFRHAFHRNKEYPPRHADILFPPGLGDSYRQAKAFVTAHPPVIEILPKFREEDKAKTLSLYVFRQELDATCLPELIILGGVSKKLKEIGFCLNLH